MSKDILTEILGTKPCRFHSVSVIDDDGEPEIVWDFVQAGEQGVLIDEAFIHLDDGDNEDKEYSVHINTRGVIIESWCRKTDRRTGVKVVDFSKVEGIFQE